MRKRIEIQSFPRVRQVLWLIAAAALILPTGSSSAADVKPVNHRVAMRDGVHLSTDVYLPTSEGPHPTVLVRTPYDKANPRGVADFQLGVARGYSIVVQDVRGRYASEGRNLPFIGEIFGEHDDAADTLKWITAQPWCNGKVGMYGGSALGMTQLLAAAHNPKPLDALHISVAPPSMYRHFVYPGGIFREHLVGFWIRTTGFEPGALERWKSHPNFDAFWESHDVESRYGQVHAPAVHVGGYFDIFIDGTIAAFHGYQQNGGDGARGRQKLVLGPWTHVVHIEHSGVLRFPGAAQPPNALHDKWKWFDHVLKGIDNGIDREPAVMYYLMGDVDAPDGPGNRWKSAATWPPQEVRNQALHLSADGKLFQAIPTRTGEISYRFDPKDPAPTVGGLQFFQGITVGTQDQRPLESRKDVLTFSTDPLDQPLTIAGQARVKLSVSCDVPDTDLFVKLCDVYPDGRVINVSEGLLRLRFRESFAEPRWLELGKRYDIEIPLSHTAIAFHRGHRVRLLITSSSTPGFAVNPNTGPDESAPPKPAHITLHTGKDQSILTLPVIP